MKNKSTDTNIISKKSVEQYELLTPLLESTYREMSELSKKKPDTLLNTYKIKMINRILEPLKELLKNETIIQYLDILDTDDLPSNSDVVIILSQYIEAKKMFRDKYSTEDDDIIAGFSWKWNIK